jgi:hypothetical protein
MKARYLLPILLCCFGWSTMLYGQVLVHTTNIKCNGDDNGKASLAISNAPGPYKITWKKGSSILSEYKDKQVADKLSPGNYTVEITDKNDCMIEREFMIEDSPPISIIILSSTGSFDYCGSKSFPDVTLNAYSFGGKAPTTCSNNCEKKVSGPGEYSFTVSDANGCQEKASVRVNWVGLVCSSDPNDITGPAGYAVPRWVAANKPMEYTIRFENDPDFATSPAQLVYIEMPFDPKVNPFSLRLGNFGFGDFIYTLPFTNTYFQERLDLQNELGVFVDVVAGVDVNDNKAFWSFQSIDPATGLPPIDPQIGFLPVNDTLTGSGEGFVTFTMTPRTTATTGDIVSANADIIFDINEEIATNTWTNKLDALPPSSTMEELDSLIEDPEIVIRWTGQDDAGGCGIRDYALYYSVGNSPYVLYSEAITVDSVVFQAIPGNTYRFRVIATDNVGNVEIKNVAEETVTVPSLDLIEVQAPFADPVCIYDSLTIHWKSTNIDSVRIEMSIDSAITFFPLAASTLPQDTVITLYVTDSMVSNFVRIRFTSLEDTSYSVMSAFFPVKPLPMIDISGELNICALETANLFADGANTYSWSPGMMLDDSTSADPIAYLDTATLFYLTGTDVFGCVNVDSALISIFPVYLDSVMHEMCNEDSVFVGGNYQHASGFYTDSLASTSGCDSTVVTEVILTGPCPFPSEQVYVDEDATGLNNGTSWANAFTDLQDALAAVEYYVDVTAIWVADGQYHPSIPTGRNASFTLRDSVKIYGGFLGIENNLTERTGNATIVKLSGDLGTLMDSTDNAYHVIRIDSSCVDCLIDRLTIQFGQGDGINEETFGAGLYVEGIVTLEQVTVERNTTLVEGSAIYNTGAGTLLILRDCLFMLNTSSLARDILNTNGAEIQFEGLNTIED